MVTFLPFALQHTLHFHADDVAYGTMILILAFVVCLILGAPVAAILVHRMDPSQVVGSFAVLLGICTCGSTLMALRVKGNFWYAVCSIAATSSACGGLLAGIFGMAKTLLLAWIVDEDLVIQAERAGILGADHDQDVDIKLPARRDGIFASVAACFSISGAAWSGVVQIILGAMGYEGKLDKIGEPQPEIVRVTITSLYVAFIPALYFAFGFAMLRFPLRGERLASLQANYNKLFNLICASVSQSSKLSNEPILPNVGASDSSVHPDAASICVQSNGVISVSSAFDEFDVCGNDATRFASI